VYALVCGLLKEKNNFLFQTYSKPTFQTIKVIIILKIYKDAPKRSGDLNISENINFTKKIILKNRCDLDLTLVTPLKIKDK